MCAHHNAVNPHRGAVIHRAKVQQNLLVAPVVRNANSAAVPNAGVKREIPDATQRRFEGVGDEDSVLEYTGAPVPSLLESPVVIVELEIPKAIQIQPLLTDKLGAGIFGARDFGAEHSLLALVLQDGNGHELGAIAGVNGKILTQLF